MQKLTPPDQPEPENVTFEEPDFSEIPILGEIMEMRHELPKDMAPIDFLGVVVFGAEVVKELKEEARSEAERRKGSS